MRTPIRKLARRALITITASVLAFASLPSLSTAAPSKQDVEDAKDHLDSLNGELSVLVEEFNLARIRLEQVEDRLSDTRRNAAAAKASAEAAIAEVNANAAIAYTGIQAQYTSLLDATSLSDFSDRLEFIGHLTTANADVALSASNAEQEARWLADELDQAVDERQAILEELDERQDAIRARIDEAREVYEDLDREYREALAAERAAAEAAAEAQERADALAANTFAAPTTGAPPPTPVVNGSVEVVIAAARSVIGLPYVFGAADPNVGFDCSGLTMWAWAHAGVSLPHSSTAQYASLPHVDRTALQPGDLVFSSYGRLGSGVIDHVALYVGGGQTIAASNPSVPVGYRPIDWSAYVGAARPG